MNIWKISCWVIVFGCTSCQQSGQKSYDSSNTETETLSNCKAEKIKTKFRGDVKVETPTPSGFNVDSYVRISSLIHDLKELEFGLDYHMSAAKYRQIMEQANKKAEEIRDLVYSAKQDITERLDKTTDIKTIDYYHEKEIELDKDIEEVESILDRYKNWEFEAY